MGLGCVLDYSLIKASQFRDDLHLILLDQQLFAGYFSLIGKTIAHPRCSMAVGLKATIQRTVNRLLSSMKRWPAKSHLTNCGVDRYGHWLWHHCSPYWNRVGGTCSRRARKAVFLKNHVLRAPRKDMTRMRSFASIAGRGCDACDNKWNCLSQNKSYHRWSRLSLAQETRSQC